MPLPAGSTDQLVPTALCGIERAAVRTAVEDRFQSLRFVFLRLKAGIPKAGVVPQDSSNLRIDLCGRHGLQFLFFYHPADRDTDI